MKGETMRVDTMSQGEITHRYIKDNKMDARVQWDIKTQVGKREPSINNKDSPVLMMNIRN